MRAWMLVIGCVVGFAPGCTVSDSVVPLTGDDATGGTADGTATDDGRDDGDSHTSRADGPPPAECQSSSDCEGICSYCEAGVCEEDVGCCSTQRPDEFGFRCSEDDGRWDDGEDDGPPQTTGGSTGGDGTTGGTDGTTAGSDTGGTDTGATDTGPEPSTSSGATDTGMGVAQ